MFNIADRQDVELPRVSTNGLGVGGKLLERMIRRAAFVVQGLWGSNECNAELSPLLQFSVAAQLCRLKNADPFGSNAATPEPEQPRTSRLPTDGNQIVR